MLRRVSGCYGCRVLSTPLLRYTLGGVLASITPSAQITPCRMVPVRRFGTTGAAGVSDKKFHCSVCKKPFRLEKAAQVHLSQAHGGDGTVEAGPGPGYVDEGPKFTSPSSAPPSRPTVVTPMKETAAADDDDDDYFKGSMRPAPKPLHDATQDVPEAAMAAMLGVWDDIGIKRLEGFVHSSMVMKVFAAKPLTAKDLPSQYQVDAPTPTGDNPFLATSVKAKEGASSLDVLFSDLIMDGTFAVAPTSGRGPMCPAAVPNPCAKGPSRPVVQQTKVASHTVKLEVPTAPDTPYGQLPMFGQAPQPRVPTAPVGGATDKAPSAPQSPFAAAASSPFAAAASAAQSPFANAASSPFAAAASAAQSPFANAAVSPFAAAASAAQSPFANAASSFAAAASAAPSPFANGQTSSPFSGDVSPFLGAQASPFASSASPFGSSLESPPTPGAETPFGEGAQLAYATPLPTAEAPPATQPNALDHVCSLCGKGFRELFDMAQHKKNKHNVHPQPHERKPKRRPKEQLPDLPAYIPSPVDLSTTSPFGSSKREKTSWPETSLVVHGHAVSNITIAGTVVHVEPSNNDGVLLSILIAGDEGEAVSVRCVGQAKSVVDAEVKRQSHVLVVGSLRLTPTHDGAANKYYMNPVVHVVDSMGSISLLE